MNRTLLPLTALLLATPAAAREAPSPEKLRASVEKLVSFGTRHSLSSATDPKRGIGAARNWVAAEFASLSKQCGGCISVERLSRRFTGPRARDGVVIEDVLGIQKGSDPNRFVIVGGHIDSRVSNVMDITSDAPGANDDASGVALVLEAARILSKEKFAANIVYVAFSGEEQGLWGATLLAETAKARGWQVSRLKIDDGCYQIRGIDGAGQSFKAKIDPATLSVVKMKYEDRDDAAAMRERRRSSESGASDTSGAAPANKLFETGKLPKSVVR